MPIKDRSMQKQISDANLLLSNIYKEDLLSKIKEWGYDVSEMYKGKGLHVATEKVMEEKKQLEMDYRAANSRFRNFSKKARLYFTDTTTVSRKALSKDANLLEELKLKNPTPRTLLGWTSKAKHFYSTAAKNPVTLSKLTLYNIDNVHLEKGTQMLRELDDLYAAQTNIKGKSQQMTIERKKALKELHKWYQNVADVCRIVFRDEPKQLVRLGVKPMKKS